MLQISGSFTKPEPRFAFSDCFLIIDVIVLCRVPKLNQVCLGSAHAEQFGYLVMLHKGSMRCTVGSSMYSKARVPGTLARSTFRVTSTVPALVTDGGEKHTISDMVLLEREEQNIDIFSPLLTVTIQQEERIHYRRSNLFRVTDTLETERCN